MNQQQQIRKAALKMHKGKSPGNDEINGNLLMDGRGPLIEHSIPVGSIPIYGIQKRCK